LPRGPERSAPRRETPRRDAPHRDASLRGVPPRDVPLLYVIAARDLFAEEAEWFEKIRDFVHAAKFALAAGTVPSSSLALQIRPALGASHDEASAEHSLQRLGELLASLDPSQQLPVFFNVRSALPREWQRLRLHLPETHLSRVGAADQAVEWAASAHNPAALRQAQEGGATFAVYGPVWEPQWKSAKAIGLEGLTAAVRTASIPILALGGVTAARVAACREAGAVGVAVASGVMQSDDVAKAIQDYMEPLLSV